MALKGQGAMAFWHDIADGGVEEFQRWHSEEHLAERLAVPGFRRGRRCVATVGAPAFFLFYEVDDLAVLTSEPYLARLSDPTPWTSRVIATFRNANRSLCAVGASVGWGVGGFLQTVQFSTQAGRADEVDAFVAGDLVAGILERPGIVAAHFLTADPHASRVETSEKRLREQPDKVADRVLIVEAYEDAALARLDEGPLAAAALAEAGIDPAVEQARYRLSHLVTEDEG